MQLKKVCGCLLGILFLLLINGIACIANQDYEKNLLTEDDRRAAEPDDKSDNVKSETQKRGLFLTASGHSDSAKPQPFQHSSYGSSPGSGFSYGGHSNTYLPPSGHGFTSYGSDHSGHASSGFGFGSGHAGSFGHSGHGGSFGHSGHGGSFGHSGHGGNYGHSSHGGGGGLGGHNGYALKGLLIPLAGIALLGAAAALSTNPVLLQLGVVNGRRRRRSLRYERVYPASPFVRPT